MAGKRILVMVDDERTILDVFEEIFRKADFELKTFHNPEEALDFILENSTNVFALATDLKMPEMSGIELIEKIKEKADFIPCYLITAYASLAPEDEQNIERVFKKPMQIAPFREEMQALFDKAKEEAA